MRETGTEVVCVCVCVGENGECLMSISNAALCRNYGINNECTSL